MLTTAEIREHYDSMALIYRTFWGDHIHHGFFSDGESPQAAQIKLIEHCAKLVGVRRKWNVLDAGCGHGGSSVYLASNYGCCVQGLTLSHKQALLAAENAHVAAVSDRTAFLVEDVATWQFPAAAFDLVWTMESSEHFFDKAGYFRNVARTLRRDGKLLLAGWTGPMASAQVREVAQRFLCPEIWTGQQYAKAVESAGMHVEHNEEITENIVRTWEICAEHARAAKPIIRLLPRAAREFVEGIHVILKAYRSGDLTYTVITGRK